MAVGQQLKKLRHNRSGNDGGAIDDVKEYDDYDDHASRPIEILPKHWSVYVLMFSSVTIVVFCFLLFDSVSSPAALLPGNGATGLQQRLGGLRAQVGAELDPVFSRPRSPLRDSEALVVDVRESSDPSLLKGQLVFEFLKGKEWSSPFAQKDEKVVQGEAKPGDLQPSRKEGNLKPNVVKEKKEEEDVAQGRDLEGIDVVVEEQKSKSKSKQESSEKDNAGAKEENVDQKSESKKDSATRVAKETNASEKSDNEKNSATTEAQDTDAGEKFESKKESSPSIAEEKTLVTTNKESKQDRTADDEQGKSDVKNVDDTGAEGGEGDGKGDGTKKSEICDDPSKTDSNPKKDSVKSAALGTPCDYSVGKWVHDENYPLYPPNTCPYIDPGFRCVENGRPSVEFQKWRWQPSLCHIPRWNAKNMLERMRGLRMAFVGDSLGRNNWESMMCMLAEGVPDASRLYPLKGQNITKYAGSVTFRFEDYNFTLEYYRSTHLVLYTANAAGYGSEVQNTLRVDKIDNSSKTWRNADIVIFNTGHWWTLEKTMSSGTYFRRGPNVEKDMEVRLAFKLAMRTVARFVEKEMDPAKTQVFFMSYAPHHFKGGKWDEGGTCNDDTKPIKGFPFVYEDKTCNNMILEMMGANVKHPVNFLNITYISDLRPDGHNSIWRTYPPLPMDIQDCSHWCLPGVPETWNEILFASLMDIGKGSWGGATPVTSKESF